MTVNTNLSLVTSFVVSCAVKLTQASRKHVAIFHEAMMKDIEIAKQQAIAKHLKGRVSIESFPKILLRNYL